MVPYLKLKEGQSLEVTEKFLDSIQGDYRFDVDAGCDFHGVHSGISVIRAGSLYCSGVNGHQWDLQGGFQKNPQGHYCRSLKG